MLLDSGASYSFVAASQVIKFINSVQKSLLCSAEPMEVHLADSSLLISYQNVHLPFQFADVAIHTVEFWVISALNYDITLGMPFLHILNRRIDWKTHIIT